MTNAPNGQMALVNFPGSPYSPYVNWLTKNADNDKAFGVPVVQMPHERCRNAERGGCWSGVGWIGGHSSEDSTWGLSFMDRLIINPHTGNSERVQGKGTCMGWETAGLSADFAAAKNCVLKVFLKVGKKGLRMSSKKFSLYTSWTSVGSRSG